VPLGTSQRPAADFERLAAAMSTTTVVLICLGTALFLIWVVSAISVVIGIRRRQRVAEARGSGGGRLLLADVPMLLELSLGLMLNVATFIAATVWYKLRGKPLPPPPRPGP
jgi:hypothetical protein